MNMIGHLCSFHALTRFIMTLFCVFERTFLSLSCFFSDLCNRAQKWAKLISNRI